LYGRDWDEHSPEWYYDFYDEGGDSLPSDTSPEDLEEVRIDNDMMTFFEFHYTPTLATVYETEEHFEADMLSLFGDNWVDFREQVGAYPSYLEWYRGLMLDHYREDYPEWTDIDDLHLFKEFYQQEFTRLKVFESPVKDFSPARHHRKMLQYLFKDTRFDVQHDYFVYCFEQEDWDKAVYFLEEGTPKWDRMEKRYAERYDRLATSSFLFHFTLVRAIEQRYWAEGSWKDLSEFCNSATVSRWYTDSLRAHGRTFYEWFCRYFESVYRHRIRWWAMDSVPRMDIDYHNMDDLLCTISTRIFPEVDPDEFDEAHPYVWVWGRHAKRSFEFADRDIPSHTTPSKVLGKRRRDVVREDERELLDQTPAKIQKTGHEKDEL